MSCKELTEECFESCPVWTWDDENEGHVPVERYTPLPENISTLFIKSRFETPSGRKFRGYLIGTRTFYAFGLFVNDYDYVLNLNLPDMIQETLDDIYQSLDERPFDMFPLKYETSVHFDSEPNLIGWINLARRLG